jgi:ABC-type Na+ efflux pump permease subunit
MKKDLKEAFSNNQIMLPMLLVPLIFVGIMPTVMILTMRYGANNQTQQFVQAVKHLPAGAIPSTIHGLNEQMVYFMTVYLFAAFFLLIPVMVSMMISANSFAGEKERKTLEGILYTPVTDRELIMGKIMASFVPAMIVSWICFALYTVVVNALGFPILKTIFFPTLNWWLLMAWVVPTTSLLIIGITVMISARVKGYQEANSIAGAVVLPFVGFVVAQASGVMYFSLGIVFLVGLLFAIIDAVMLWMLVGAFHRDRLVAFIK